MLTKLKIPNIIQRRDCFNGIQIFRCFNDLYPPHMSDMLQYTNEYNNYMARSTQNVLGIYLSGVFLNIQSSHQ